jgi:hypothetical protein
MFSLWMELINVEPKATNAMIANWVSSFTSELPNFEMRAAVCLPIHRFQDIKAYQMM